MVSGEIKFNLLNSLNIRTKIWRQSLKNKFVTIITTFYNVNVNLIAFPLRKEVRI